MKRKKRKTAGASVSYQKNVVEFSHIKKTPKVRVTMPVMAIVEKDGLKYQLVP